MILPVSSLVLKDTIQRAENVQFVDLNALIAKTIQNALVAQQDLYYRDQFVKKLAKTDSIITRLFAQLAPQDAPNAQLKIPALNAPIIIC